MRKTVRPLDIVIAVAAVAISFIFALAPYNEGRYAEIYVNGEKVRSLPLSEEECVTVNGVTVTVEDGCAKVTASTCKDKICVSAGELSQSGDTAICIPNRVSVLISGENSHGSDAVTY